MIHRRSYGLRIFSYYCVELLALATAFFLAYLIRQRTSPFWGNLRLEGLSHYVWLLPVMLALWSVLLWGTNSYSRFRSRGWLDHVAGMGTVSAFGILGMFSLLAILNLKEGAINRSFVGLMGVTAFAVLVACRIAVSALLEHQTAKGYDRHYVLIGGTGPAAVALAEELTSFPGGVFEVRGLVTEAPAEVGKDVGRWKVLGAFSDIPNLAVQNPLDEVYLLPGSTTIEPYLTLVETCESMGIVVHLRLTPFEQLLSRLDVHTISGGKYLSFSTAPPSGLALTLKRIVDFMAALGLLIFLSPLLLVVAILVKLTSRGPAIFWQERAGMNGRVFTLYKFRTMVQGAELARVGLESQNEMDGPVFKIKQDPRITGLGRILRRTSIDELPQIWNVLKGDMSLVGPRPLPTYEVEKFERWQRRRMTMRPGITGLWQIGGRTQVGSFADWMKLDLEYVDNWSLALDVRILLRTIPAVLLGRGAY